MENAKKFAKNIEKDFFSKNHFKDRKQRRKEKAEKGGALIRAGAHCTNCLNLRSTRDLNLIDIS